MEKGAGTAVCGEGMELNLICERTPVSVGRDRVTGDKVYVYLNLDDISVIERAEAAYKHLNSMISGIKAPPKKKASDEENLAYVAELIRKANQYAKQAIDDVFDEPISAKLWGNASCISFGDDTENSRFGRAVSALLELYKPAVEAMANKVKEQSDAFAKEVLDEGDDQA